MSGDGGPARGPSSFAQANTLASWSIRNPIPTLVVFLVLTVAGLVGFMGLRINNTPDIEVPVVTVTIAQPGAAPTELESQVTRLVEDTVAGLGNVDHVKSTVNDGVSTTAIEFEIGIDVDRATNDVRNAVSRIRSDLPADVREPIVNRVDVSGMLPLISYAVRAPDMAPEDLSWFVDDTVAKAMLAIPGVAKVERGGGVSREIRVRLDPARLMALGITAGDVSNQLRATNINMPGGRATVGDTEQSIRTLGSAASVADLAATRINLPDGRSARLSDLGKVEDSWAEQRQRARFDNNEVVSFGVYRAQGSNEVGISDEIRKAVDALRAQHGNVEIREITSGDLFVRESYFAAIEALALGALLAVAVVWWFLRDVRATLISAVAMPLSLIPTFAVMGAFDYSLNIVTLLALSLIVGILVDDAIVEVENTVRHMREGGKTVYEAAIEAANEIGLAVIATTATIIAVFLPVGFMSGVEGQFFRAFAISACFAVFFSLVVARMLTPLMGAYLLKPPRHDHEKEPFWMGAYMRSLGWTMRHRWLTIAAGIGFFVGSVMLAGLLPSDFVPASDRGRSVMSVELPPGATLDETDRTVQQITAILLARPEVRGVYASIGTPSAQGGPAGGGASAGEVRKATLVVNLKPPGERDLTQQQFEREAGQELQALPGVRMRFGADGSSGARASVILASDDAAALNRAVTQVVQEMKGIPGLANVASTAALSRPELLITPLADKAAALGVSANTISQAARIATQGDVDQALAKFNLPDRQIPIRVMLEEQARADLDTIANLKVRAGNGQAVPLSAVASFGFGSGPAQIDRLDRRRSATIEAELGGQPLGEVTERIHALPTMRNLPAGVQEVAYGTNERMANLFRGFAIALAAGVLLVYTTLVLLFRGFLQPLTIMTALPLSLGGALGLLLLSGKALSLPALIGIVMLMGIAAKNSILLVEYAIMARTEHGLDRATAILDAARKRARPIIMTTVAMGAGMLPIALGIGADTEFRSPMAIAVIGGLISSTILCLLYVPVVYTVVDDIQRPLNRFLRRFVTPKETSAPQPPGAPAE
ncbi:efflux RND transporter permease subunit [Zavarzinia sp. CC-PAN008]|uniref:efflux RND transporter permease subunit n=1 Tax=Zavarzinia sp. CC-PAN008 TaxID=3243332 RepID=UPI003F749454